MNEFLKIVMEIGVKLQNYEYKIIYLEDKLKRKQEELQIWRDTCIDENGQIIKTCHTCKYWDKRNSTGAYDKYCWDRASSLMGVNVPCNKWVKK